MAEKTLEDRHLAELHALAAKLDVPTFRKLGREDLVAAIRKQGGDDVDSIASEASASKPAESRSSETGRGRARSSDSDSSSKGTRGRRGRGRSRGAGGDKQPSRGRDSEPRDSGSDEGVGDEETEPVEGILDVMPRRYGFLRLSGLESADGDVYISASQIRRCELVSGDRVAGPARKPRRGERHPALVHVDTVNGVAPETERGKFEDLTPVPPTRRVDLSSPSSGSTDADILLRAVDLLSPLALGQRVLVQASARSGRTTLLRGLAKVLAEKGAGSDSSIVTIVALIDERPEEATRWREEVEGAELSIATAEMRPGEQVASVELALARAKRTVESGTDVVLIVDSLSRLAVAQKDAGPAKALFGSGRETSEAGAGSLTVIATFLEDGEDDDGPLRAVQTTESAVIRLDPELAAAGVVPALDHAATRCAGEAELRSAEELASIRSLRERLAGREAADAARELADLIKGSADNAELLRDL